MFLVGKDQCRQGDLVSVWFSEDLNQVLSVLHASQSNGDYLLASDLKWPNLVSIWAHNLEFLMVPE